MIRESETVQDHYAHGGLLEYIDAFLKERGVDLEHLTPQDLFACDQIHGRGVAATQRQFERAGIGPGMHVLDLGCGIGGASRYIAAVSDSRVTGIDLTREYIDVARELTARCGLGDRVVFQQADALDMPFDDASFDHVWSQNVTMNIADKAGLIREIARVLRPGGRLSCSEYTQGPGGEPYYPLPWAVDPSYSFLLTPEGMRAALEAGGFRVIEQIDLERAKGGGPPSSVNPMSFKWGKDYARRPQNAIKCAEEGRLVEQLIVAEKA